MPVTTTVSALLTAAHAVSLKNQPDRIATQATELVAKYNRTIRRLYSIAAGINPTFFGVEEVVTEAAGTWVVPEAAESVYWLQDEDGEEVIVVPKWDVNADPSKLTVYSVGRVLKAAGVNDPTGDIEFSYAKKPDEETALTDVIDLTWDESYNELIVQELALYLSMKDGREEEFQGVMAERNRELRRFTARLEHEYANLRSKFGPALMIQTSRTVSPHDMLIGEAA
jgi:hypothetical protein